MVLGFEAQECGMELDSNKSSSSSSNLSSSGINLASFVSATKVLVPTEMFKKWLVKPTSHKNADNLNNILLKYEVTRRVRNFLPDGVQEVKAEKGKTGERVANYIDTPSIVIAMEMVILF